MELRRGIAIAGLGVGTALGVAGIHEGVEKWDTYTLDQSMAKICYEKGDTESELCSPATARISPTESEIYQRALDVSPYVVVGCFTISMLLFTDAAIDTSSPYPGRRH